MTVSPLKVLSFRAIRGEPLLEGQLDALNHASKRPTPFNGRDYLSDFLDNDEFGGPDQEPRLLAAVEGDRLVGFLPLRRRAVHAMGVRESQIEFLITFDNDRPCMAARPEDEPRCAAAFWRYLFDEKRDWSVVQLANIELDSPLLPAPGVTFPWVRTRVLEGPPIAIVPTNQGDVATWYKSLKRSWRHTIGRQGRKVLGTGKVEYLSCRDPRARLRLLDLYLDLERRSWKSKHGIGRRPERLAHHRAMCDASRELELFFQFIMLDGVVIAGMICADFPGVLYGLETCYDSAYPALGAGNIIYLLSIGEAIQRGSPPFNFFADFAYYKASWGAALVPTCTLQLFRAGSAHWLKSLLGDFRRRHAGSWLGQQAGRFNKVKRQTETAEPGAAPVANVPPVRDAERALVTKTLAEFAAEGVAMDRLSGATLAAAMPFPAGKEKNEE